MPSKKTIIIFVAVGTAILTAPWWIAPLPIQTDTQSAAVALAELSAIPAAVPLTLITEPEDGIGAVQNALREASSSVDLVIYELEDPAIESALSAAEARGVRVRVILQNVNTFGRHPNQAAYDFLKTHGVPVIWAPSYFALTHEKALVTDQRRALIMTFNLAPQYYATSRDFGIEDSDPADVAAIETAFDSDWSGAQRAAPVGHDLVWSPDSAPLLLELIGTASSTLDVYNEEMADPRITTALEAAAARDVRVRITMTYATSWKAAFKELSAAGVVVRTYASSASFYIHAKAVIADDARVFVGSENFSAQSLNDNRELGIVLNRPDIIASLESTFGEDFSRARPYTP